MKCGEFNSFILKVWQILSCVKFIFDCEWKSTKSSTVMNTELLGKIFLFAVQ